MGFEDNNEAQGFEGEQLDLDGNADLAMGTGRTRAQRKKGVKTEEVAFTTPKRDRFGRRGDGEEAGSGADMLNPDKPTRIAGGFSRREMTPQEVKPLQSENSKFAYLFSENEEDEDEVSTVKGKRSAVDALAMKGDEADAGNVFQRETRSVIHSQGKPQRRSEPEQSAQNTQRASGAGRFSRRGEQTEQTEKPATSRFSRRSAAQEAPAEPKKEEPVLDVIPTVEEMNPPTQQEYTEPAPEEATAEPTAAEQEGEGTVYAENQPYGYGNPYMYGQYPQGYPPYGAYPQPNPYGQPYGQPYQPYGQQPYPYQYPAGYPQPQYIPVGYVFQAGFVPVEMTHNAAPRRRKRPSAARSAHRYDQTPELPYSEQQAYEPQRIRAIAARSESAPAEPVAEPIPEPVVRSEEPVPEVHTEPAPTYESQYDRIAAEIPQEPVQEEKAEVRAESTAPARFARRGASASGAERSETAAQPTASSAPSRFSARGASSRSADSGASYNNTANTDCGENTAPSAPSGGRFNRRGQ